MEITSVNNELVKETAKLQQKKYRRGKFLLEGFKAIKEAIDCGIQIEKIFIEKNHLQEYDFITKDLIIETTEPVLKKLSTTESAPNAVAVGIQKIYSSTAFGADAIVLYGESVDIYNPKCVRASVGNLWKLPIIHIQDFEELKNIFANFERIATLPRTNNLLKSFKTATPCLIMFGSEADGLSQDLIGFSTNSVKIEMAKTVESLNLAVSVSVILYELFME